jgi:hypothetical protein
MSKLMLLWGRRNSRILRLYTQNPAFTERTAKCALERLWHIFRELQAAGRPDVARQALTYLQSAIEDKEQAELFALDEVKETMAEEILADFHAVAELQDAIDAVDPPDIVRLYAKKAIAEIDRTVAKYVEKSSHE